MAHLKMDQAVPDWPAMSAPDTHLSFLPTLPAQGRQQQDEVTARSQECTRTALESLERTPEFRHWQAKKHRVKRHACVWKTCRWLLFVLLVWYVFGHLATSESIRQDKVGCITICHLPCVDLLCICICCSLYTL